MVNLRAKHTNYFKVEQINQANYSLLNKDFMVEQINQTNSCLPNQDFRILINCNQISNFVKMNFEECFNMNLMKCKSINKIK